MLSWQNPDKVKSKPVKWITINWKHDYWLITSFRIVIKFNVNHTVDSEEEGSFEVDNQQQAQQEAPKLYSKPNFDVEIVKNETTLSLNCTFLSGQAAEGEYGKYFCGWCPEKICANWIFPWNPLTCVLFVSFSSPDDIFGIEELIIFKGTFEGEKVYACSGDMLDGYFYDLMMNLLSEKGVTDEFVQKISELATHYEQSLFINLMEETKKFFESK